MTLTPKENDRHAYHLPLFALPRKEQLTGKRSVAARLSEGSTGRGWGVIVPEADTALLSIDGGLGPWCHASRPIAVHPGDRWYWKVPPNLASLSIETGYRDKLRLSFNDGGAVEAKAWEAGWKLALEKSVGGTLCFENSGKTVIWFRLADLPVKQAWVATNSENAQVTPVLSLANKWLETPKREVPKEDYIAGRFGKAIVVRPGKPLSLPDHEKIDGVVKKFFDAEKGTLEFWIKPLWDVRLHPESKFSVLGNGVIQTPTNLKFAQGEWTHIALVWRPLSKDPSVSVVHAYVNGHDQGNYRNVYWPGYGDRPPNISKNAKWLEALVSKAPPGTAFALDELRLSSVPRYMDADAVFGRDETVNRHRFTPASKAFASDAQTLMLHHFDGNVMAEPRP